MGPAAPVGSVVVARPTTPDRVTVGMVILVAPDGSRASLPTLHRVVALDRAAGAVIATTKGDTNALPDADTYILPSKVFTTFYVIPHLGRLIAAAEKPLGWIALVLLPATGLAAFAITAIMWPPPTADDRLAAVLHRLHAAGCP